MQIYVVLPIYIEDQIERERWLARIIKWPLFLVGDNTT